MNKDFAPVWDEPVQGSYLSSAPQQPTAKPTNTQQKQIVTIRLDVDMLDWFKSAGPGYQTRINQLLRDHMDAARAKAAAANDDAA
ncbi:BrnA antitoxin family protein [Massilia sp. RP-1-19]|uniref:BrnA antitoxin family protein n=1 Tax=Massilia polaris TaxID=2728846 RepID=A0A848HWW0_9BURK|nr:BrnA antitoxin family protein [Massilia polaris]NML63228.1 BrnA antitoxin family protein [Massilia polaris]